MIFNIKLVHNQIISDTLDANNNNGTALLDPLKVLENEVRNVVIKSNPDKTKIDTKVGVFPKYKYMNKLLTIRNEALHKSKRLSREELEDSKVVFIINKLLDPAVQYLYEIDTDVEIAEIHIMVDEGYRYFLFQHKLELSKHITSVAGIIKDALVEREIYPVVTINIFNDNELTTTI